jgi:hypothetical protein
MRDNREAPDSTESAPSSARSPRNPITTYWRPGGLAVFVAAAAVALAAFSVTNYSHAASAGKRSASGSRASISKAKRSGAHFTIKHATDNSTGPLEEWAACERGRGDSNQADPTVDHQVIYIAIPLGALPGLDPNDASAPCGNYLAAARSAVAGGQPVAGWGDNTDYVQYANCMRANGYPTYPYPSGIEPDGNERTNFNGTGIDPNSPAFLNGNANQTCGKQIGAPAWWINNWGPPGSVDVYPAGTNPNNPWPTTPPPFAAKPSAVPGVTRESGNDGSSSAGG